MIKSLYSILGLAFVGLAFVGILFPLIPTTPFLLLAAGCFARSSPRCQQWLHSNRICGPFLKDWDEKRCLSPATKIVALSSLVFCGGGSLLLARHYPLLQCGGLILIGFAAVFILRLKTCSSSNPENHKNEESNVLS